MADTKTKPAECANTEPVQKYNKFNSDVSTIATRRKYFPQNDLNDVSVESQRARLRQYLECNGSCTTFEARQKLNIVSPAPRIMELREMGWSITTIRVRENDQSGRPHLIGKYVWHGEVREAA